VPPRGGTRRTSPGGSARVAERLRFYTSELLGPKQAMTPDGFLVCYDVPVARTGMQVYAPGEVPIAPGADGTIRVDRDPDEVFRPETLASGNGKYVTIDHPPVDVTPENCKELGRGHAMNFRRGENAFDDATLADLFVSCPEAMEGIRTGRLKEISLGYDSDYEEIEPGHGRQSNIVINHIALLGPGEARCGPRCSIGDHVGIAILERSPMGDAGVRSDDSVVDAALVARAHRTVDPPPRRRRRPIHFHIHA
jgi:uncharacterized protein